VSGVLISVCTSSTEIFEVILVIFCDEELIHFLVIYSCFTPLARASKSFFRMTFIENVFVHETVTAEMVLIPLVHFLVREIINWFHTDAQELMVIVVSLVVQDFTPDRLIGSSKVSVVRFE